MPIHFMPVSWFPRANHLPGHSTPVFVEAADSFIPQSTHTGLRTDRKYIGLDSQMPARRFTGMGVGVGAACSPDNILGKTAAVHCGLLHTLPSPCSNDNTVKVVQELARVVDSAWATDLGVWFFWFGLSRHMLCVCWATSFLTPPTRFQLPCTSSH